MQSNTADGKSAEQEITFSTAQSEALIDYWNSLAIAANGIPARASFDPIAIPKLLPYIILYERLDTDKYQVRLQGTNFSDRGVPDNTGTILIPNKTEPSSLLLNSALARIIDTPCGLRMVGIERNAKGKNALVESLGLPLVDGAGTPRFVAAVVGVLETLDYSNVQAPLMGFTEVREATEIPLGHLLK